MGMGVNAYRLYSYLYRGNITAASFDVGKEFSDDAWIRIAFIAPNFEKELGYGRMSMPTGPLVVQLDEADRSKGYKRADFYHFLENSVHCTYHRSSEPGFGNAVGSDWKKPVWDVDLSRLIEKRDDLEEMLKANPVPDYFVNHPLIVALKNKTLNRT